MFVYGLDASTWISLDKRSTDPAPATRAQHSAVVMGDYMVVFGGHTHCHNSIETCYDDTLQFYHLACRAWIPRGAQVGLVIKFCMIFLSTPCFLPLQGFIEHAPDGHYRFPNRQGLYGHSAVVRKGRQIVISGGYRGSPSDVVFAYLFPEQLSVSGNSDATCTAYESRAHCLGNPGTAFSMSNTLSFWLRLTFQIKIWA